MTSDKTQKAPVDDVLTLADIEQVKVLTDPLRLRLLELFKQSALTTKQAAEILGEKPTRLYHHVEALEGAGVIRLVETRPNRGTTEKYYRSVARTIVVDPTVFTGRGRSEEVGRVLATMFEAVVDAARAEVRRSTARGLISAGGPPPVLVHIPIRTTAAGARKIKERLQECIREVQEEARESGKTTYAFTMAFYPIGDPKAFIKEES